MELDKYLTITEDNSNIYIEDYIIPKGIEPIE